MNAFGAELLRFISELRAAEIPVSVAEMLDAMRAVTVAGLEDRTRVREALAAALIKDEADRAAFDETFARFFGAGGGAARKAGGPASHSRPAAGDGSRGDSRAPAEQARPAIPAESSGAPKDAPSAEKASAGAADASAPAAPADKAPADRPARANREDHPSGEIDSDSHRAPATARQSEQPLMEDTHSGAGRYAASRDARRVPFAAYTALEYEAARSHRSHTASVCGSAVASIARRSAGWISGAPSAPHCSAGEWLWICAFVPAVRVMPTF